MDNKKVVGLDSFLIELKETLNQLERGETTSKKEFPIIKESLISVIDDILKNAKEVYTNKDY